MKLTGIFKKHPFLDEEVEIVEMEERDFDFSKKFDDLEFNDQANFLSFIKCPALCKETRDHVLALWYSFQMKNQ